MFASRRLIYPALLLLIAAALLSAYPVSAQGPGPTPIPPQGQDSGGEEHDPGQGRETCLACHRRPDLYLTFPSGETISVTVNEESYFNSVHGQHGEEGYKCIRCHTEKEGYPHQDLEAESLKEYRLSRYTSCSRCHAAMYNETLDSVHQQARERGQDEAAVCTDCHQHHDVQRIYAEDSNQLLEGRRKWSVDVCSTCHNQIYQHYQDSIHGQALFSEDNSDVPTCIDCHGVHDIAGPTSASFRLESPRVCADCHTDEDMMKAYDLSTHVFDTYVDDFHGTTVSLYQGEAEAGNMNEPVCTDCHGVHQIMDTEGPESISIKENLLETCQRCHPGAPPDFPDAWLSHYLPSLERTPGLYIANLIYQILIPVTIGGMAVVVVMDFVRKRLNRSNSKKEIRLQDSALDPGSQEAKPREKSDHE